MNRGEAMTRSEKTLARMRANPRGWRYEEVAAVLRAFGFSEKRRATSHRQWTHPVAKPLTIVAGGGVLATYQVDLVVRRIDELQEDT